MPRRNKRPRNDVVMEFHFGGNDWRFDPFWRESDDMDSPRFGEWYCEERDEFWSPRGSHMYPTWGVWWDQSSGDGWSAESGNWCHSSDSDYPQYDENEAIANTNGPHDSAWGCSNENVPSRGSGTLIQDPQNAVVVIRGGMKVLVSPEGKVVVEENGKKVVTVEENEPVVVEGGKSVDVRDALVVNHLERRGVMSPD